jgi:hypothetical protein
LLLALADPAAAAAELKTLTSGTLKGDLVSLSDKEIVLTAPGSPVTA